MKYWEVVADKVSAKRPGVTAAVYADVVTIGGLDLGEQDAHPDAACFDGHPLRGGLEIRIEIFGPKWTNADRIVLL